MNFIKRILVLARYQKELDHKESYEALHRSHVGHIRILEVSPSGKYIRLFNSSSFQVTDGKGETSSDKQSRAVLKDKILLADEEIGGFLLQQNVAGRPVSCFRFPPRTKVKAFGHVTVWAASSLARHNPPTDFVWSDQHWITGPNVTTIFCRPNGQAIAWTSSSYPYANHVAPKEEPVTATSPKRSASPVSVKSNHQSPPRSSSPARSVHSTKTPSVHSVARTSSVHSVARAPSVHSVARAPSVHSVAHAPAVNSVARAPSVHSVARAPSYHSAAYAPSVHSAGHVSPVQSRGRPASHASTVVSRGKPTSVLSQERSTSQSQTPAKTQSPARESSDMSKTQSSAASNGQTSVHDHESASRASPVSNGRASILSVAKSEQKSEAQQEAQQEAIADEEVAEITTEPVTETKPYAQSPTNQSHPHSVEDGSQQNHTHASQTSSSKLRTRGAPRRAEPYGGSKRTTRGNPYHLTGNSGASSLFNFEPTKKKTRSTRKTPGGTPSTAGRNSQHTAGSRKEKPTGSKSKQQHKVAFQPPAANTKATKVTRR